MASKYPTITLRLSDQLRDMIQVRAQLEGISMAALVKKAVLYYLSEAK